MSENPGALNRQDVQRRFERAARHFDDADFLHRATAEGMLERMLPMRLQATRIIDLGSATGNASRRLAKLYRPGRVVSLDLSAAMLAKARSARGWLAKISEVQADATALPFADGSADLVFANLLLPWIDDVPAFFCEVARVLQKDGLFVFSTLGPDSLLSLRQAWQTIDRAEHVNRFADMHDVGDALLQGRLRDPVLDVDNMSLHYSDVDALFRDLTNAGARNSLIGRRRTLTPKQDLAALKRHLRQQMQDDALAMRLELIFGHAWGSGPATAAGEYRLDPAEITRRRR